MLNVLCDSEETSTDSYLTIRLYYYKLFTNRKYQLQNLQDSRSLEKLTQITLKFVEVLKYFQIFTAMLYLKYIRFHHFFPTIG